MPTGLLVGEWSNCALLSPLLAALTPCESVLDAEGVVVLDIPTAQLLRLADAEQQCEAIVDGPQCAPMRRRFVEAQLIIAVLNDNDDPEEACGGRHWSVVAVRTGAWRDGTFILVSPPAPPCDAPPLSLIHI